MTFANLQENIKLLEKQLFWLNYSYQQIQAIDLTKKLSIDEFNHYENLCSRFSRTVDFLIRKMFRSIDAAEFENQGTLVDVINNAHKRKLFDSVELIRTIKELRNEIVHEYLDDELMAMLDEVSTLTPELIKIINETITYSKKLLNS
jgi:uncharacterized protein YutE (UPF0331/DUF86 family)